MSMQRSIRTSLAGAIAFAVLGITSIAAAQPQPQASQQVPPPPPPPPQPMTMPPATPPPPPPSQRQSTMQGQQQGTSGRFYQGTKSTATYPIQNGTLTVNAGMPAQVWADYGPPPAFTSLDANGDGRISQSEAKAFPPLDSDFLYASGNGKTISRAAYDRWVKNEH